MGEEDPYDFEIAIPSAAGGGRAQAPSFGRYGASDSDEDDGRGDRSVDVSDLEDDDEEEEPRISKQKGATSRLREPRAAAATSGGGDALDKARSFLSRYSATPVATKASAAASSRRSRVELSLDDDDDLSLDSSRGGSRRSQGAAGRDHDSSSYFEDESPVTRPVRANAADDTRSALTVAAAKTEAAVNPVHADADQADDSDEESGAPPPPYTAPPVVTGASTSTYGGATKWNATAATARVLDRSGSDGEQSIEADSVSSQSESREQAEPPARALAIEHSAPSESGVYEEEAFDEESVPASPDSCPPAPQELEQVSKPPSVATTAAIAKPEPTFDYSMDFSDDGDSDRKTAVDEPLPAASTVQVASPASEAEAEDAYESEEERSALLESDDDSHTSQPDDRPPTMAVDTRLVPEAAASACAPPTDAGVEYSDDPLASLHEHSAADPGSVVAAIPSPAPETEETQQKEVAKPSLPIEPSATYPSEAERKAASVCVDSDATSQRSQPPSDAKAPVPSATADSRPSTARPRVVIVRAYESSAAEKPEMRDASTQFTGNHAGVQTELVPDGMHNLWEPTPLSALHQPLAASTSLYKQQLLALQEQIQQKKRETQRLVSERMSFQYTSLRGTERFIAGRRPPRLALWEALMRVDPTLDEKRAKEAARLVHGPLDSA